MKNPLRALFIATIASLLLISCQILNPNQRQEIEELPGAVFYSSGESSASEMFREAAGLFEEGKFEQAESLYREILEVEPDNPDGYVGLGGSLLYQDRLDEAEKAYNRALELAPRSVQALIGLGSVSYGRGDYSTAEEHYRRALEFDDEDANAHWGRAIALEMLVEFEQAIFHDQRFIELAPDSQLADLARESIEYLKDFGSGDG